MLLEINQACDVSFSLAQTFAATMAAAVWIVKLQVQLNWCLSYVGLLNLTKFKIGRRCYIAEILALYLETEFTDRCFERC